MEEFVAWGASICLLSIIFVLCKSSWGVLPSFLLASLNGISLGKRQKWPRRDRQRYYKPGNKKFLTVDHVVKTDYKTLFEASTDLLSLGMQSIMQDDFTRPFELNDGREGLLNLKREIDIDFTVLYFMGLCIRYGIILPIRVCLMTFTLFFLTLSAVICVVFGANQKFLLYCGITFAKLFNMSTGLLVFFSDEHNRPKMPGVVVSNHISANDVMTIYSGCDYNGKGYTITGQNQGGFVNYLFKYGGKLTPLLLVDRACDTNRKALHEKIVEHSQRTDDEAYPVLLFPEGYCSNNKVVLQFRKAIFDGTAPIYPIALKQNSRFGDSFWGEKTYLPYLFRLMTSWCSVIEVYYLPPMFKLETETKEEFAYRVQSAIAAKLSVDALPFDGKMKSESEREKYKRKLQSCFAAKQWGGVEEKPEILEEPLI